MLTKEQKENMVFYLLHCRTAYPGKAPHPERLKVSLHKKTLMYCDAEKAQWDNVPAGLLKVIPADRNLTKKINVEDFLEICRKLFPRWR